MNELELLNKFPENKLELERFVGAFIRSAMDGNNEPLAILKKIKVLEEITKKVRSQLSDFFQDECDKYNEKTIDIFGCNFQKREFPIYDYSVDSEWVELNRKKKDIEKDIKDIEKEIKDREAFLKTVKSPVADVKTGEIINPVPKKVKSSIAVILK